MGTRLLMVLAMVYAPVLAQATGNILIEEIATPNVQFNFKRDYNSPSFSLVNQSFDYQTSAAAGDYKVQQILKAGYIISNITCDFSSANSSVSYYANGAPAQTPPPQKFFSGADSIAIHLANNDTVECHFFDQPVGSLPPPPVCPL